MPDAGGARCATGRSGGCKAGRSSRRDWWDNLSHREALHPSNNSGTACPTIHETAAVEDHFEDVLDMVDIGSGAKRRIADIHLSRYACYLIVQNGEVCRVCGFHHDKGRELYSHPLLR